MVTERNVIGKIEILEDGQIQIREDVVIERDGKEVSRLYHRRVIEPGYDAKDEVPKLKAVCDVLWTPDVIAEFQLKRSQQVGIDGKQVG